MSLVCNILIMIVLISLLILVHEIGHFIAARMCGIRVTRFGIGMPVGPSWKLFRWKHTDFYLHAFFFGGYVSFPEDEPKMDKEEENKEIEKEEIPENELYENKTTLQKLFVVTAGVLMNILFAIFLVMLVATVHKQLPTSTQELYADCFICEKTSNIEEKGIKKGDRILKINSQEINVFKQLVFFAKNSKLFDDYAQKDLIDKNMTELTKLNPQINEIIEVGTLIKLPAHIAENPLTVNKDVLIGLEKYKKDGLPLSEFQKNLRNKIKDKKTYKVENQMTLNDLAMALSDTYKPVTMTILREGKEITIEGIKVGEEGLFGMGIKHIDIYTPTTTPKDIVIKSLDYLYTTTVAMLKGLWNLICGKVNAQDMHGVVAVVKVGADVISAKGISAGLLFTAMISLNLAIMNFLPIPALDGGHVMFLLIEKLTGRKPSQETAEKINNFFFILLMLLIIVVLFNDVYALITKKF